MSEESEEACLVNPRSPSSGSLPPGIMPYTDGIQSHHQQSAHNHQHQQQQQPQQQQQQSQHITTAPQSLQGNSSGRGSQSHESESGELIDYNDEMLLSQFHADAIKQAGCGKFQTIAAIITGLGLAGHSIQVFSVFYILPSAEVEYCILDNEKNWLASITLLGLGVGALFWGGLCGRAGRRKVLLSCMAVSAVFSVIAAFMPTYGPFMMARFCAAAGVGGALPAASSYLCEMTPASQRSRILGILGACGVAGGIFAGGIATLTVPKTGQLVVVENKEHFSAWHRYLLLCTLPTIAAILGIFWLPESPRYLLESGREVEALAIYQKIYKNNRTRGGYALTELELPGGARHNNRNSAPASVLAGMAHSVNMFCMAFVQLFGKFYLKTTVLLLGAWFATIFVHHGMTIYISEHSRSVAADEYDRQTTTIKNQTYENTNFNVSMDNIVYLGCRFQNCTFGRMFISHVKFEKCSFIDVEFANVKTSKTLFQDSILEDTKLIDTDLTTRHFINCIQNNTQIIRLTAPCDRDFEYNIFQNMFWKSNLGALIPGVLAMALMSETVCRAGRSRMAGVFFISSIGLCVVLSFAGGGDYDTACDRIIWIGGSAQGLMLGGLAALTLLAVESYTTPLRCTALGLFVCGGHMGALIGAPIYSALSMASIKFAAGLSTSAMIIPSMAAIILRDPCLLL